MKLSILIPTLPQRKSLLSRLLNRLEHQLNKEVEVLIYEDNGVLPYGDKINTMVSKSKGKYIVCIDDDDLVPEDYIEIILKEIKSNPDFIGYNIAYFCDGEFKYDIQHSYDNKEWTFNRRGVSPKCIIKKDIFKKFVFGNEYTSDQVISHQIEESGLINKSSFVDKKMYIYDFWANNALGASYRDSSFQNHINNQRVVDVLPFNKKKFIWI